MPVYNSSLFLKDSIECILNQTYENFEFVIIDDGSSDNTVEIVKNYKDSRIKLFVNSHDGFITQLNFGLKVSSGEYIARMDGDDLTHIDRLRKQLEFLKENKDIILVGTNFFYINEKGKILQKKIFPELNSDIEFMMPIIPSVLHGAMFTKKQVLVELGGYDVNYFCEDVVLFLKMISKGYKLHNLQEYLYSYRIIDKPELYYKKHYDDYYEYSLRYLKTYYENRKSEKDYANY